MPSVRMSQRTVMAMSEPVQFEIGGDDDGEGDGDEDDDAGSFYVIIADGPTTVYEAREAAFADVQDKLNDSDDAFVAELTITGTGDDTEVGFSQVEWPKIIREMQSP